MKHKITFILLFLVLYGLLKFIAACELDVNLSEKDENSTYQEYTENPERFIVTTGKIIDEYSSDSYEYGFFNFFGASKWLIEIVLSDGTVIETDVLRDENDNIGDIIDVAYLNKDATETIKYTYATQLHYVELFGHYKTINIVNICIKITMGAMIGFAVFIFVKKRGR